jgi:uncharacterized protein YgiB involved in biofilm formation
MPGIVSLMTLLGQAGFPATGASVQNEQDFWVPLVAGYVVKVSYGEDANTVVANLQLVLSSDALKDKQNEIEYVDLRFGNKVYYKLKGGVESTSTSTPSVGH